MRDYKKEYLKKKQANKTYYACITKETAKDFDAYLSMHHLSYSKWFRKKVFESLGEKDGQK